ncbi:MAG: RNA polymerase sigma factor, partial [Myxococcota bacterium]|nr:RNA polymerase sigma factor [Myxococcota bacterium]
MAEPTESFLPQSAAPVGTSRHVDTGARALDDVMDRCARGDDAAFDELYRGAAPRVRGFLLRLCGDHALADDLTQEVFLRIHRARGSFATGAAALPWMLAIARNGFRDHVRRAQLRPATRVRGDNAGTDPEAAPETRGDEALFGREMLDVVRDVLLTLPVTQREAFVLIRFEGLSVSEAAQILGAT